MGKTDQTGKIRTFRLTEDVMDELDRIATHHSSELGTELTRSDALRIAVRKESERIRKTKAKK